MELSHKEFTALSTKNNYLLFMWFPDGDTFGEITIKNNSQEDVKILFEQIVDFYLKKNILK